MPPGHVLDASTIGLWQLRERERRGLQMFDETGARTLIFDVGHSASNYAASAPGRNKIGRARRFTGASFGGGIGPGDPDLATVLSGSCTIEVWVNPSLSSGDCVLFQYGSAGETAATNFLALFYLRASTARLGWFHEFTGGNNVAFNQSSGATVPNGTWAHVAVVKTVTGGNCTIKFYINGALIQTSGTLTNCTGGESDFVSVGATCGLGDSSYIGDMKDMRISNVARGDAEIAVSAAATDQRHALDASTVALYRMDEVADATDSSSEAMHLTMPLHDVAGVEDSNFELFDIDTCGGRNFNGETEYVGYSAHQSQANYRAAFEGDFTFECWLKVDGTLVIIGVEEGLFSYGIQDSASSTTTNPIGAKLLPTGKIFLYAKHGAGVNATYTTTASPFATAAELNRARHLAITKRLTGGGNFKWEIYVDGVFVEESGDLLNYESSPTATVFFRLGSSGSSAGKSFKGLMYDVRLSNVRRTAAEIGESSDAGVPCLQLLQIGLPNLPAAPVAVVNQTAVSSLFGVDFKVLTDIDKNLTLAGGLENLGMAIGRRFYTDEGFLFDSFEGDADYGKNILGRLNAGFTQAELAGLASQIEAQCRQDPRVKDAEVTVNQDTLTTSALNVEIALETSEGPFALVMKVTADIFTVDVFVPEAVS